MSKQLRQSQSGAYARDASLAAVSRIAPLAVQLVATPFVLATTGTGAFAVWALMTTTINLMLTADLGVVGIMQRYHGIARGRDDPAMGGRVTATVLAVLAILLVVVTALGPVLADLVLAVVRVAPEVEPVARLLFQNAGTLAVLQLIGLAFASYLAAASRFGAAAIASLVARGASFMAIVVLLSAGMGLEGLLIAAYLDAGLTVVLGALFCMKHLLFEVRALMRFGELKELWAYAWRNQASAVGFVAQRESDLIIAAVLLPVSLQATVASTAQLVAAFALAPTVLLAPLFTRLSVLAGASQDAAVREARTAETSWFSFVLPFAAAVLSIGPFFAAVWLGPEVPEVLGVTAILSLAFIIVLVNPVRAILARSIGRPGIETWSYAALFAVKLAAGIPATLAFGLYGLAASSVVSSMVAVLVMWVLARRTLPQFQSGRVYARSIVLAVVIGALGTASGAGILHVIGGRWLQLLLFAVLGVLIAAVSAVVLRRPIVAEEA